MPPSWNETGDSARAFFTRIVFRLAPKTKKGGHNVVEPGRLT